MKNYNTYKKEHFVARMRERYNIPINSNGMRKIKRMILDGKCKFLIGGYDSSVYEVEFNKYRIVVAFDWNTKSLITALPPSRPVDKKYLSKYY